MSDNMCEHGGLDGNCLRCKDATITRLEAENERLEKRIAELEARLAGRPADAPGAGWNAEI